MKIVKLLSPLRLLSGPRAMPVVLAGLSVMALLAANFPAFSQTRYSLNAMLRCTREENIMRAFHLLQNSQGEASLRIIVDQPIRVIFKDMKTLHKGLKNYDALSWISMHNEHVIFINEKHRNAPPEALAAMIAHEAMHNDELNSLSEEIQSWEHEAKVWMELKAKNPALAKIPPGTIPLVDRENKIEEEARKGTLAAFVRATPGYQDLPETSPGFNAMTASNP